MNSDDLIKSLQANKQQLREQIGELDRKLAQLAVDCSHSEVEVKDRYVPGDYYTTSYTMRTHTCKTCGSTLNESVVRRGGYG